MVYIFFGSRNGIITVPAQKITSPTEPAQNISSSSNETNQMFGYGMSKGVDIDGNGFLDIAIGSPNSDQVFVYKSYPVIRPNCSIVPPNDQIQRTNSSFNFIISCEYESNSNITIKPKVKIHASIKLDAAFNRAYFAKKDGEKKMNKMEFNDSLPFKKSFSADYTFLAEHVFNPINIEVVYNVSNDFRNHIDPSEVQSKPSRYL